MRILPSQVVGFARKVFSWVDDSTLRTHMDLASQHLGEVSTFLELIESVPPELIDLQGDDFLRFVTARHKLKTTVAKWASGQAWPFGPDYSMGGVHPIATLTELMERCPDTTVAPNTPDLLFVRNVKMRAILRRDLSDAEADLEHRDYKSATVLAGSIIEAFLLEAIERRKPGTRTNAVNRWIARGGNIFIAPPKPPKTLPAAVDEWSLAQMVEVAVELDLLFSRYRECGACLPSLPEPDSSRS